MIKVETFTAPAYWASYLVNGDSSGLSGEEIKLCDEWCKKISPYYVVSIKDDDETGEFCESYFTHSYRQFDPRFYAGEVIDYIAHKSE